MLALLAKSPTKKTAEVVAPKTFNDVPVTGQAVAPDGKFAAVVSSVHCRSVHVTLNVEGNWTMTLAAPGAV